MDFRRRDAFENLDFRSIVHLYEKFNEMSSENKRDFTEHRKLCLKNSKHVEDYQIVKTTGTTGTPKQYKWGPNFSEHHRFYQWLFYPKEHFYTKFVYLPNKECEISTYNKSHRIVIGKGKFKEKIKNCCIVSNPEIIFLIENKRPFLKELFDLGSCAFCLTGSPLTKKHSDFFDSIGMEYRDYMRSWDGGATFFTCEHGNKHWVDFSSEIKLNDNKLMSTDLWNESQPHIDYWNGDVVKWQRKNNCQCGLPIDEIEFENRNIFIEVGNSVLSYEECQEMLSEFSDFSHMTILYSNKIVCFVGDFEIKNINFLCLILNSWQMKGNLEFKISKTDFFNMGQWKIKPTVKCDDNILEASGFSLTKGIGDLFENKNIVNFIMEANKNVRIDNQ